MLRKNNKLLNYGIVILGALIYILVMYLVRTHVVDDKWLGWCGIGISLFWVGITNIVSNRRYAANPDLAKRKKIEINDERNKLIRYKTSHMLYYIILYFLCVLSLAVFIFGAPLWIMCSINGMLIINVVLDFIISNKYNKSL